MSLHYDPVTNKELCRPTIIMKLNKNKSTGPDNIGPKLIKFVLGEISDPLQYIYNLSFQQGTVPQKVKLAKVVPVCKSGDALFWNN